MPTVSFNAQSFAIDGRRVFVVGASVHYVRVPVGEWSDRIAAAKQAGFNTIETAAPWMMHEPRKGRYVFQGQADVKRFVQLCQQAGMHVLLKAGPYIGAGYDGGGLPSWLDEVPGMALREANETFLERAGKYLRRLVGEVAELLASAGGPILLVQAEHAWTCVNRPQEERYLNEISRILRESGVNVPIVNANDLWPESPGTIDTWRGAERMLSNVRQLRTVQPDAPRLVGEFDPAPPAVWGEPYAPPPAPEVLMRQLVEILAAGGQPIVAPFHGGTNFGFLGGRVVGDANALRTTSAAPGAALGEAGARTASYRALKRAATFASHFGNVLGGLDPDYQPVTLDPGETLPGPARGAAGGRGLSVVPLRGGQGRVVFVFSDGRTRQSTLLLDNGMRLPIDLGDQLAAWYLLDVDLQGQGRLDYANLSPLAMVGRSIVVLQGPEKSELFLSVGGTPLQGTVPSGAKPLVLEHKGIVFVVVNQAQADVTYHDGDSVYVGIGGFDGAGAPWPAPGYARATVVAADGKTSTRSTGGSSRGRRGRGRTRTAGGDGPPLEGWKAAPAVPQVSGESPRYATLDGPQTLAACGAASGYGWYRIEIRSKSAARRQCHVPEGGDRLHLYLNGELRTVLGVGPGAEPGPVELSLRRGANTLVVLAENYGRFSGGNDLLAHKGIFGHVYQVKSLTGAKSKLVDAEPVDPFRLRGFILGLTVGQVSDGRQVSWSFTHHRKSPILVDVIGASCSGTFVLNGEAVAYYGGASGARRLRLLLDPRTLDPFKRGRNELRFAPDLHQDDPHRDIRAHTSLYECAEALSDTGRWAFAKWEPPAEAVWEEPSKTAARSLRGAPVWWKASFSPAPDVRPTWLQTAGLSKGQVYVNGQNLGRYFTSRADGKAVGPQKRLYLPRSWVLEGESNDLVIFDEHGFDPGKVAIVHDEVGELEEG